MKKYVAFVFGLIISLLPVAPLSAHVLEFDDGIGAILHIDPQDDPVAGELTTFYFEFRDKDSLFNAQECTCRLRIIGDEQLLDVLMKTPEPDTTSTSFRFPSRGVYKLVVSGEPQRNNAFARFELNFTVRVNKGSTLAGEQKIDYVARGIYLAAGGIIALIIFLLIRHRIVYTVKYYIKSGNKKSRKDMSK